jgi:hypothetical protein
MARAYGQSVVEDLFEGPRELGDGFREFGVVHSRITQRR